MSCDQCANRPTCKYPCYYLAQELAGLEVHRRGPLSKREPTEDYKALIARIISQKAENLTSEIREIPDMRLRGIAAMLNADMPVREIVRLRLSKSTLYQHIKKYGRITR